jgi:translation initiation factor 4A
MEQNQNTPIDPIDTFDQMKLKETILRGIYSYGFEKPSLIQQKAIVPMISGIDLIAQSQSGTGKTATFSIAILERINPTIRHCQALILAPTRELAIQINQVIQALGQFTGYKSHVSIGGTNIREDSKALRDGVHIVVGTPGRIYDMIQRRDLNTQHIHVMVLDEADEMLSRGFKEQMVQLFEQLTQNACQICLFSATLPADIMDISNQFMKSPIQILVKKEELTLEGIKQFYIATEEEWKLNILLDLYETFAINQCILYCNTRRKVDWIKEQMTQRDFTVACIHSDLTFVERQAILQDFRQGTSRVLISTDLLARGIDIQHISLVVNYDLPPQRENYIHRIGRSGRFGRKGVAINLITKEDIPFLRDIEQFYHTQIDEMPENISTYF